MRGCVRGCAYAQWRSCRRGSCNDAELSKQSTTQVAVIASAFAKAKIFDATLFAHLSRAVQVSCVMT